MDDRDAARAQPTIGEVAEAAGVSRASVSRAFTQPQMLGKDTVTRILAVADRLGYVPNRMARALSTGRSANVALVVPDVANPFFPPLIHAAQLKADEADFCVFLGTSGEDQAREDKLIARFAGQVEGLILVSPRMSEARIRAHAASRPLVLVNRDVTGIPRVLIDSAQGVAEAMSHLADLGHRRVVYVGGPPAAWANAQRLGAVRQMAGRRGVKVVTLEATVPAHDAGAELAGEIRASGASAVVAFDDVIAQGVMAGLAALGVAVPGDISVVGCDDVLASAAVPALTSVSNRSAEAGARAVALLLERLGSRRGPDLREVLDTGLVVRASTGPARA